MRERHTIAVILALVMTALGTTVLADMRASTGFQLIVHPENPVTTLNRKFVEDAFLKKVTRWPHGGALAPVDQTPHSPVRRAFSEAMLKRSTEAVRSYWQQLIFGGRDIPPPEFGTDDEVVEYVRTHTGGIGYVSTAAKTVGVKVIRAE